MGTFCSDRVRKINGYEQPREARLSKHECPKFITPISPCPALPYSPPQEREEGRGKRGETGMKRKRWKKWSDGPTRETKGYTEDSMKEIEGWKRREMSALILVTTLRHLCGLEKLSFTFTQEPDACSRFTDIQGTSRSHWPRWSSTVELTQTIGKHLELGSDKGDLSLLPRAGP